ncbi:hydroxyisourate hydrolase [Chryseobacterium arthrosphaerae]|uniref:5-hydroxyisourate hydrolase n=1 Tax=Chryseobacterium arthrosphaerae TaxID=651561 RepID=A0A1B8ZJL9_9FLAO|nr:hydroxyisourate hydrolase [Chryseobacterium arthrosphaerae]OCA71793.1 hydroxyisourate hydrolase [Chryseobacterium arthrosphaerae]
MKKLLLAFFGLIFFSLSAQEKTGFQLSSHILDISEGKPAGKVEIALEKFNETTQQWVSVGKKQTDNNGRVSDFLPYQKTGNHGKYKLVFFVEDYYKYKNIESFYPSIEVIFQIKDSEHYHVPITLSPFGYSTYRGS